MRLSRARRERRHGNAVLLVLLLTTGCDRESFVDPPAVFQNPPISPADCRSRLTLIGEGSPRQIRAGGDTLALTVSLGNLGQQIWADQGDRPIRLGIAWFPAGKSDLSHHSKAGEQRIPLPDILLPGDTVDLSGRLGPVTQPGEYDVWIGPVQDGVAWCWNFGDEPLKVRVHVVE